jgi:hypothetical protein
MHTENINGALWNIDSNYFQLKYRNINKKYNDFYKGEKLSDYNYITVINNTNNTFIPQLIFDAILSECLILYYGNDDILKYFDKKSLIIIDNNEEEYIKKTMNEMIRNNLWNVKIENIRKEKDKILEEYNLCNICYNIIMKYHKKID